MLQVLDTEYEVFESGIIQNGSYRNLMPRIRKAGLVPPNIPFVMKAILGGIMNTIHQDLVLQE